jgi:hypothetical protein
MRIEPNKDGQFTMIFPEDNTDEQIILEKWKKFAEHCHYGLDMKPKKLTYEELEKALITSFKNINELENEVYILKDHINTLTALINFANMSNPEQNLEHFRVVNENQRKMKNLRYANKDLREKLDLAKHRLKVANEYIETRKGHMLPEHYEDLKYIVNECDIDSSW